MRKREPARALHGNTLGVVRCQRCGRRLRWSEERRCMERQASEWLCDRCYRGESVTADEAKP